MESDIWERLKGKKKKKEEKKEEMYASSFTGAVQAELLQCALPFKSSFKMKEDEQ